MTSRSACGCHVVGGGVSGRVSSATAAGWTAGRARGLRRHGGPGRPAGRLRGAAQPLPGDGQRALRGLLGALAEHEVRDHLLVGAPRPLPASPTSAPTRRRWWQTSSLLPRPASRRRTWEEGLGEEAALKPTSIPPGSAVRPRRAFLGRFPWLHPFAASSRICISALSSSPLACTAPA